MKFDMTITISVVIAVCAILSPIITTLLNNHHLYKMRKLDMKLEKEKASLFYKRGIYESYLKSVGKCIACWNETSLREYGEIYPLALMYFPENLQPSIISLDELISKQNWNNATTSLNELAPKIRTILQNM